VSQLFNFGNWLTRLGYKRSDEPEIIYAVQPVQVVSDVASLTPEVRGPSALFGGLAVSAPGNFAAYDFVSAAPGGTLVGQFVYGTEGASDIVVLITPTPAALDGAPVVAVPQIMQGPIIDTARLGRVAVSIAANDLPRLPATLTARTLAWSGQLWVPPGQHLIWQAIVADVDFSVIHTAQELPVDPTA